ncbi:IS110 family transposase ISAzo28 [Neomoorella glycerini]|uniref:IS110 family transposase ISAzo28 n=1 Tax=Neomoorella glycerini TaxID=55779 RepID=A0A6I5ZMA5_9FIRM|nr:IS110 family transposase [Moorella glycerini]QGP90761.1 IS110 family transposase ISAzo28 [Moorella glycerini]QGP90964.1 IS110 family transposase ISAzo28 [Moorella glycerini]QGP91315.1 IS110 family transposase ISAzo28 [Moorella glycerini]QGP91634.1 IS110 family transposase ISAzo28 [Moorella glycerini]QGP91887.1 IS110 family transposase ISAzo28 [Moorella glycerini]
MEVVYERCCGLDVHKKKVVACLITPGEKQLKQEIRTFGTMTEDLEGLRGWLLENGVTAVAMESTGVYWKPIYNILEGQIPELILINPEHFKALKGKKTDCKDAVWLAELLRHGLLAGSFIPPKEIRELRELTRYRAALVAEHSREVQRVQKQLENSNIKLSSVATDIMGVSGREILKAMLNGNEDPKELAQMARGKLRKKIPELEKALEGKIEEHTRLLLKQQLEHLEFLEQQIEELNAEIEKRMEPFFEEAGRLAEVNGIKKEAAQDIIAEIGVDMTPFPDADHLASWAGVCPGNNESAGKRKSGKTRKGNQHLRAILVQCSWAAIRTKDSYLSAKYRRLAPRLGKKKALLAIAHSLIKIIYHLLKDKAHYQDPGPNYYTKEERERRIRRLVKQIEAQGYTVTLEEKPSVA